MYRDAGMSEKISRIFEIAAKAVISLVVVAIFVTILAGTAYTVYDFRLIFSEPFHEAFRTILIDILTVLAIMEILRTALAYYSYGRVKVTYIIDAVLVTTLTEIMAFWYRDIEWQKLFMALALVLSLALVRIIAIRFSPEKEKEAL
ncbi:MAG: hypothetical protein EHM79_11715 [Geobacter sp.]|nr:MAG: hypothetical protein EHM79_11715 [Geobacter sp.]